MAILPPTHPLVEADRFPVERLRQEPFIEFLPGQETDNSRMLQQLQIRPKIRFATSDSRAAIAMVRAGLGITLLNDILTADLADGVAVLPLDPPQSVHLASPCRRRSTSPPPPSGSSPMPWTGCRSWMSYRYFDTRQGVQK